eukprot:scaffold3177_cov86-Phaeocystis_antarctica.AAC.11
MHGMCTARARHVHGTCTARAWRMHGMWGASPAAARAWRERAAAPQAARALPRSRCGHRSCRRSRPPDELSGRRQVLRPALARPQNQATLAGPRGRTAASHWTLGGVAARPECTALLGSLEGQPQEARLASCGTTRAARHL